MERMGERIKELRQQEHLTQAQLAERLGVTQDSISLWETGKRIPDTQYLPALCRIFQVSADYLLGLEDESGEKLYTD